MDKKVLEIVAENHRSAVYTEISYKQGMKDIVNLVVELIDG